MCFDNDPRAPYKTINVLTTEGNKHPMTGYSVEKATERFQIIYLFNHLSIRCSDQKRPCWTVFARALSFAISPVQQAWPHSNE